MQKGREEGGGGEGCVQQSHGIVKKTTKVYHIRLQDRLHNLHNIRTTTFILKFRQANIVLKSNSSANLEKIEGLFSLINNVRFFKRIPDSMLSEPEICRGKE